MKSFLILMVLSMLLSQFAFATDAKRYEDLTRKQQKLIDEAMLDAFSKWQTSLWASMQDIPKFIAEPIDVGKSFGDVKFRGGTTVAEVFDSNAPAHLGFDEFDRYREAQTFEELLWEAQTLQDLIYLTNKKLRTNDPHQRDWIAKKITKFLSKFAVYEQEKLRAEVPKLTRGDGCIVFVAVNVNGEESATVYETCD